MQFSVNSAELQRALSRVSGVVPNKSTLPILENVLFSLSGDELELMATDLEVSIVQTVRVDGGGDGKLAVPARRLSDTLRALPDVPLTFESDGSNRITLATDKGTYKMQGESGEDFPKVPEVDSSGTLTLDGETLKRMVSRTLFAVSTDELRPAMMGVKFELRPEECRSVATDGHRLVRIINRSIQTASDGRNFIVPSKALNLLMRGATDDTEVALGTTHVRFSFGGESGGKTTLISRLIHETYPNYESVIPLENDRLLRVNRAMLLAAIRRVGLYSSSTTHQIKLAIRQDEVVVSAEDLDMGGEARESVLGEYNAEAMEIGFNAKYVEDVLTHIDAEEIVFGFSSPTRAAIISPADGVEGEEVLMLVMPVRLNS